MKRNIIVGFLLAFMALGVTSAAGILDYFQEAQWSITPNAGYVDGSSIEVSSIDDTSVVINTPIIKTEFEERMDKYILMYWTNTLSELLEDSSLINNFKDKTFDDVISETGSLGLNIELLEDYLDPNEIYYAWVLPMDEWDIVGTMSNQVCFRMSDGIYWTGESCKDIEFIAESEDEEFAEEDPFIDQELSEEEHDAAGIDLNLANITYTVTSGKINLAWMSLDDTETLNIFLRDETANIFKELGTVPMSAEAYQFSADTSKTNLVKILPVNGGREVIESIRAEQPKITEVPATGPKENAIAIIFLTLLWYVFYRSLAKRKA